jgi:hypothetical protein
MHSAGPVPALCYSLLRHRHPDAPARVPINPKMREAGAFVGDLRMYSFVESITKDFLRWKCGGNDTRRVEYLVERDVISEDLGVGSSSCGKFVTGCVCSSFYRLHDEQHQARRRSLQRPS